MSRLLPVLLARGPLRRGLIATALGASLIAAAPSASAGCDGNMEGAVVGALVGGLAGGAIGNEIRDEDNDRYGYYGRGYGRGYGSRGRGYRYNPNSGDGDEVVVAGALLGALAGAAIGSQAGDCDRGPVVIGPDSYGQSGYRPADPYARGQVTRSGEYGWGDPQPSYPAYPARPAYPSYPSGYPAQQGYPQQQGYPAQQGYAQQGQPYSTVPPAPRVQQRPQAACETVYSETQFPDGRVTREPVKVCRDDETGQWYRAGSATDDELYGY